MNKLCRLVVVIVSLVVVVPVTQAEATTLHIYEDGSGDFPTIQTAIDDSGTTTGDVILVHNGSYAENINFKNKAITVRSKNGPNFTTIDGSSPTNSDLASVASFVSGEGANSVLEGFTIINGQGTLFYDELERQAKYITIGGGVLCLNGSSPTIIDCIITSNSASKGGGIYCENSWPTIKRCVISSNSATKSGVYRGGGGIYCLNTISSTTPTIIENCIIIGNSAAGYTAKGGGILSVGAFPMIINCTIAYNSAKSGGGIACSNYGTLSWPTVVNSILWENSPDGLKEVYLYNGGRFYIYYSDFNPASIININEQDWGAVDCINEDPLFVNAASGNYHLQAISPCKDTGTNDNTGIYTLPTDDIDGNNRPSHIGYDMGADEYIGGCTDADADGYYLEEGCALQLDCNDNNPDINPAAMEICDGIDNNCDDRIDEVCGNVDGNDCIDDLDVSCLYQWVIGSPDNCLENVDVPSCHSCDVDGNGRVDIMDVLCINRRILGSSSCLDSANLSLCIP